MNVGRVFRRIIKKIAKIAHVKPGVRQVIRNGRKYPITIKDCDQNRENKDDCFVDSALWDVS
jgi:hypothetical protein